MAKLWLAVFTAWLVACSSPGESRPGAMSGLPPPSPPPALEPGGTPVSGPLTLRVVSYNVLWGGGFDPRFEEFYVPWQRPVFGGSNRLPDILDMLESLRPDILAVQEAAGWSEGDHPVGAGVATRLGMHYFVAQNAWELNTALFSRFPILDAINLSPYLGTNSALAAIVQTPDGQPLVLVNVHLDPFTSRMRGCQVDLILEVVGPLSAHRALLIGDFNFRPGSREFESLLAEGWEPLVVEPVWRVDHIWARSGETMPIEPLWPDEAQPGVLDGRLLSDHHPIGALITLPEREAPSGPAPRLSPPRATCRAP